MAKTFKDSRSVREQRKAAFTDGIKVKKAGQGKHHRDQNLWKRMWNEELLAA